MASCRHCGDPLRGPDRPFEACRACADSPLCDGCGHPRGDHGQVFVRGVAPGCRRRVGDFQTLTSRPCTCPGFRPVRGALRDASFTEPPEDEPALPALRLAGQAPAPR